MKLALLFSILVSFSVFAQPFLMPISAVRHEGEDYTVAMKRATEGTYKSFWGVDPGAAQSVARKYSEYELPEMEAWSNYKSVREAFRYVRDLRFVESEYEGEEFMRRSSWLYPDDGCFIRAELMVENLLDSEQPLPNKIFVIGNLNVATPNGIGGKVSWWYHVAPIVRVGRSHYVIDPALKTKKPLKLASWLKLMNEDIDNLKIAVCGPRAMTPNDNCYQPYHYELEKVMEYQHHYLAAEWQRLVDLDRDPVAELGDNPPWKYLLFGFIPMER